VRIVLGTLLVVAGVVAGTGWLYLLRRIGALDFGPRFKGALPLQQLRGNDSQALARMLVAWLPFGVLAGIGLRALGARTALGRAAWTAIVAAVVLMASGAGSDAIAANESLSGHVQPQLTRPGTLAAVVILVIGTMLVAVADGRGGRRGPREPPPAASGP
jgi:hypothetical protein